MANERTSVQVNNTPLSPWVGNVNAAGYTLSNLGQLQVEAAASVCAILNGASGSYIQIKAGGVSKGYIGYAPVGSNGIAILDSAGSGNPLLMVTGAGLVGIGTASPASNLHIRNDSAAPEHRVSGPNGVVAHELGRLSFAVTSLIPGAFIVGSSDDYGATYGAGELQCWTGDASGAAVKRLTIDKVGNLGFGITSFGGGVKVLAIANATTPPGSNPTGGGVLYAEAGALKYRGSSGTVTTLGAA
jgi:hypothetical protein